MYKKHIQLYSLKNEVYKDFPGTLRKVKEIGYDGVEFFGGYYGNMSANEMKGLLAEIGLEPISAHIVSDKIAAQVDYAAELGMKYIFDPMANIKDHAASLEFAKKLNEAGELCKRKGIVFGYHNHAHEFIKADDGYLLETLILNTNPDYVCFQLDVGWSACAGVDEVALIAKYPGRFKSIHFKELGQVSGPEEDSKWKVAAGKGIINWEKVFNAAFTHGVELVVVEREHDYQGDIYKCVKEDFDFLSNLL